MQTRRALCLATLLTPLSGCTSYVLAGNKKHRTEQVSSVLLSQDKKTLVVITDRYHYVFPVPAKVVIALEPDLHPHFSAMFFGFTVDQSGSVDGTVELRAEGVSQGQIEELARYGYSGKRGNVRTNVKLTGKRFEPGNVIPNERFRLNRAYQVNIEEPAPLAERAVRYMATPVTMAADGVLLIVGIPLLMLAVSVHCYDRPNCLK